jgi:hypothetical protein
MEKRIITLSLDPHAIGLIDRVCSLFIAPKSGCIFIDEGDGEGRMNGAVFAPTNAPSFSVQPLAPPDHMLLLSYCGVQYVVGVSENGDELRRWAESANSLLEKKRAEAVTENHPRSAPLNRMTSEAKSQERPMALDAPAAEVARFLKGFRERTDPDLTRIATKVEKGKGPEVRSERTDSTLTRIAKRLERVCSKSADDFKGRVGNDASEFLKDFNNFKKWVERNGYLKVLTDLELAAGKSGANTAVQNMPIPRVWAQLLARAYEIPPLMLDPLFSETCGPEIQCLVQSIHDFEDVTQSGSRFYGRGASYAIPPKKLATESDIGFGRLILEAAERRASHSDYHEHPGSELMLLLSEGRIELRLEWSGVRIPIKQGEFVHFRSEMAHSGWNCSRKKATVFVIRFYQFKTDKLSTVLPTARAATDSLQNCERIAHTLKKLTKNEDNDGIQSASEELLSLFPHGRTRPYLQLPDLVQSLTQPSSSKYLRMLRRLEREGSAPKKVSDLYGLGVLLDRFRRSEKGAKGDKDGKQEGGATAKGDKSSKKGSKGDKDSQRRTNIVHELQHAHKYYHQRKRVLRTAELHELAKLFQVETMLLYPCVFPAVPDIVAGRFGGLCKVPNEFAGDGAVYRVPRSNLALANVQLLIVELSPEQSTRWNHHPGHELAIPLEASEIAVEFGSRAEAAEKEVRVTDWYPVASQKGEYAHFKSSELHRLRNTSKEKSAKVFVVRFYADVH